MQRVTSQTIASAPKTPRWRSACECRTARLTMRKLRIEIRWYRAGTHTRPRGESAGVAARPAATHPSVPMPTPSDPAHILDQVYRRQMPRDDGGRPTSTSWRGHRERVGGTRSLDASATGGIDDDPRSLGPGDVGCGRPRPFGGVLSGARLGEGVLVDRGRDPVVPDRRHEPGAVPLPGPGRRRADRRRRSAARSEGSRWRSTWSVPRTWTRRIAAAVEAGGSVLKPGTDAPFGRSGYFADPDGYPWEVAYNRDFPIGDDGRLTIP